MAVTKGKLNGIYVMMQGHSLKNVPSKHFMVYDAKMGQCYVISIDELWDNPRVKNLFVISKGNHKKICRMPGAYKVESDGKNPTYLGVHDNQCVEVRTNRNKTTLIVYNNRTGILSEKPVDFRFDSKHKAMINKNSDPYFADSLTDFEMWRRLQTEFDADVPMAVTVEQLGNVLGNIGAIMNFNNIEKIEYTYEYLKHLSKFMTCIGYTCNKKPVFYIVFKARFCEGMTSKTEILNKFVARYDDWTNNERVTEYVDEVISL